MKKLIIITIIVAGVALSGCNTSDSPYVTLVLDDATGLDEGAPVLYQGVEAGEVSAVKLVMNDEAGGGYAVAMLAIQPEVFTGLYDGMTFRVDRASWIEGTKHVVINDRQVSEKVSLAKGAIVMETSYLEHIGNLTTDGAHSLLEEVREVKRELLAETGSKLVDFGQWLQSDN